MAAGDIEVVERRDLAALVSRYRRYLPYVIAGAALGMLLAGAISLKLKKLYTASASVMFSPQNGLLTASSNPVLTDQARDAAIDAQIQLVQSLQVATIVLDRLHLESDPDLQAAAAKFAGNADERKNAMATALLANVRARRSGQTNLFEVTYTDPNPLRASEIANTFVAAYLRVQVEQKVTQARGDASRIGGRLAALRDQVQKAEAAVSQYKVANGLISTTGSTLAEQEISSLNSELATTRAQQAESQARFDAARRQIGAGSAGQDVGDALASPVIGQLRQQRSEASRHVAELEARYGPRYPDVVTGKEAVASIDKQIQQETDRILSNLRAQTQIAQQRTASIDSSLNSARGRLATNNSASVKLAELERDAESARTLYENFLNTSKQTNAAEALIQPDARISGPAVPPLRPSSPNVPVNVLLGMVLGFGIGLGAAFVRDRWVVGLDTIDDIERQLGQVYLNSLPTLDSAIDKPTTKDPMEAIIAHPLSLFAESFRNLGTSMLYSAGPSGKVKVLGITSALPKEGKSTTSVCLARVMAMGGARVILLDVDLRRRSTTDALARNTKVGLIQVLQGEVPLADAIQTDEPTGMDFLGLAPGAHLAKTPFASDAFGELMATIRANYDIVIMDTAPVLAVVDTRMLLQHIDALALLARWRATPIKAIRTAVHQVESVGGRVLGVAMTLVNVKIQQKSGYGDPSYYYTEMKDYYQT